MIKEKLKKKIFDQIDQSFEEQLTFLSKLVSFKSLVGEEAEGQIFFAKHCHESGLEVQLLQPDRTKIMSHPAYIETGLEYSGRYNVIAEIKGEVGRRSLILNGHMDVVSPEPVSLWSTDPWEAKIIGNRMYGRGVLDMKAGLSANLFALKGLLSCGLKPEGRVILESVLEEETGGSGGTLACFTDGIIADGMIVTEPSLHAVWITHPGVKYFRVKVLGKPAHAALSHKGVNAITKIIPIIKELEELDRKRAERLSYPKVKEQTGRSCNLSIGKMSAGDWVSTVAGWAIIEGRIGFVPGETGPKVMNEVEETIKDAVKDDPWFQEYPPQIEWFGWKAEPWVEDENSPFIKAFLKVAKQVFTFPPKITGSSAALDTRFGSMFGTPTLAFGPKGENYHGPDEYVDIDSLLVVTKILALFIAEWCGLKE